MVLARKLARLFLVAALLAGWQASLEHPLRHVDAQGAFVHLAGGERGHATRHDGGNGHGGAPQLLCDAIAGVAAVVGNHDAPAFQSCAATHAVPAFRGGDAGGAPRLAYRSHAPPLYS
jgi:hypothetical protein